MRCSFTPTSHTSGLRASFGVRRPTLILLALCLAAGPLVGCAKAPSNRGRVIVLAGASSGLGKGVAQKLADQGAHVVVAARRTELLNELAADCERRGAQALAVTADVSKSEDVERLTNATLERFGRIDVWVNLAGVSAFGDFDEIPLADHSRLIDVNVKGVINGSHYAMRQFRQQKAGTLINISSVTGRIGQPYYASYAASKFAVTGLGLALNQEVRLRKERDIKVCTIYPYATDTPFWDHAANYTGHQPYIAMMDPPEPVVNLIVKATVKPGVEMSPNLKTKAFLASHRMNRRITENLAGDLTHRSIFQKAPPAPDTKGSLHEPMPGGTTVDGGLRQRVKEQQ